MTRDGEVVRLGSVAVPPEFIPEEISFETVNGVPKPILDLLPAETREHDTAELTKLMSDDSTTSVELDAVFSDKLQRRTFHQTLRKCAPMCESTTKGGTGEITITKGSKPQAMPWPTDGKYMHFSLYKENRETMDIIRKLAFGAHKGQSFFSWGGTKDKRGITVQRVSAFKTTPQELLEAAKGINEAANDDGRIAVGAFSAEKFKIELGQLGGNRFTLVLRDVVTPTGPATDMITTACESLKKYGFANYFGLQRFGTTKIPTHQVGAALWRRDFIAALRLLMAPLPNDRPDEKAAKEAFLDTGATDGLIEAISGYNRALKDILKPIVRSGEFTKGKAIEGFSKLHKNQRTLYLCAFQSYMFNLGLTHRLSLGRDVIVGDLVMDDGQVCRVGPGEASSFTLSDVVLPLVGHATVYPTHSTGQYMRALLANEDVSMDGYMGPFTMRGDYRKIVNTATDVEWSMVDYAEPDAKLTLTERDVVEGRSLEIEAGGRRALRIGFTLGPSTYATMVLRELMKTTVDESRKGARPVEMDAKRETEVMEA